MRIIKRIVGSFFLIFALVMFGVVFIDSEVDFGSPEAFKRIIGTSIAVVVLGAIGFWLLFSIPKLK